MKQNKNILILGATSTIAVEVQKILANDETTFYLVARNKEELDAVSQDLKTRGAKVVTKIQDLADESKHDSLINDIKGTFEAVDVALLAYGVLPNQENCQKDLQALKDAYQVNLFSAVSLLTRLSNQIEKQNLKDHPATIAVISSVAGDRGRQSNYVYGSAKAGLTAFLSGLRSRLLNKNIHVLTILPGFVDTKMTADLKKGILFATPQSVAIGIVKAIENKNNVVYLPFFWKYIMLIVKIIPEMIFKNLKF